MGLLDALFGKGQFDPQTYDSPTGSGWLGPVAGGRVPMDQAQPPRGSAPTGPLSGAVPPVSMSHPGIGRPADQQNPLASLFGGVGNSLSGGIAGLLGLGGPTSAQQAPGLLERLSAGATNLTTGGDPIAGIVNAVNGLATGQRTDATQVQQAALRQALAAAGVPDALASAAAFNPEVLKAITSRLSAMPRPDKSADASGNEPTMSASPDRKAIAAPGVPYAANAAAQGGLPRSYAPGVAGRAGIGAGNPIGRRPDAPPAVTREEIEAELQRRGLGKGSIR